jgi:hypothetical protein
MSSKLFNIVVSLLSFVGSLMLSYYVSLNRRTLKVDVLPTCVDESSC